MDSRIDRAVAIVGMGALLPDAPNARTFWKNIVGKRYSIIDVPPERWSIADYYDPDPSVPDKTYSKIGGWVRGFTFDWQRFRIPPRVAAAMDEGQQWAVTLAAEALADYGYPERPLNLENTGVILGTAMGGELHYLTNLRVSFPEYANALVSLDAFQQLPADVRAALLAQWRDQVGKRLPPITEDSMPGELANVVAGRVANVLNLRGPNFISDAACASTFAALDAAVELLVQGQCDAVITGGVDRNMGASTFIKFSKIGALSASGTRPFGDGADGFVMGEGAALFLLKRLADAERDGDAIYAVIRGVGGSSDGKGKGITAPNPLGQVLAMQRAWKDAGLDPATATLVEAHGTSTKVGDVVEVESLAKVFGDAERGRIALGSAKSNIGHLKAGAGAAGLLKTVMALHEKVLPPTLNAEKPNPSVDFGATPFYLNHEPREWQQPAVHPRRAAVSAYGFGGTNFHIVLEEYVPGIATQSAKQFTGASVERLEIRDWRLGEQSAANQSLISNPQSQMPPIRGILALSADTPVALKDRLDDAYRKVEAGWTPPIAPPDPADLRARERLVIDFGAHAELLDKLVKARKAAGFDNPQAWKALQAQGIFRGSGQAPGKVAFLFPGQGSQYVNMGRELAAISPAVAAVFAEADQVMTPILGKPLTSYIFVDNQDPDGVKQAEKALMQTAITQPAMLATDIALCKLLGEYGFAPDMVMGHSLGEYAALIAAGIMPFADALEAAAARGAEMTKVSMDDNGWMAAVMAPLDVIQQIIKESDGYVVAANINSYGQAVIGGASTAVKQAIQLFTQKGFQAQRIPVSHAFHTRIVAPASKPLRQVLNRLRITSPRLPLVANVTGDLYPTEVEAIKDILEQQIASPVQWVKGLETLYANGIRTFVEVGPKKALKGFVDDVLGGKPDVVSLFTNHPKTGELASFNQVLCGLYAAGYGLTDQRPTTNDQRPMTNEELPAAINSRATGAILVPASQTVPARQAEETTMTNGHEAPVSSVEALSQIVAQALQTIVETRHSSLVAQHSAFDRNTPPVGSVVISGAGLGLPGAEKPVMDPDNAMRILRGEQFIDLIPERFRRLMLDKNITRLVKSADGSGHFEAIADPDEVIKLAARPGAFDLAEEYGVPAKLIEALDVTTQLAMAAGLDALREAGIPLVQAYKKTTKGTYLPERWMLPEALRDETGVVFASAFPGYDRMADEFSRYYAWENRRTQLAALEDLRRYTQDPAALSEIDRRIGALRDALECEPYEFDRRFLFRILSMGHSQFAEYIGARGPNTQVNAACASTTQAIGIAEDWIRSGRCRRVVVVAADDVTSDRLLEWIGAGFLATGAAATDDRVDLAALPFDRRRHGMIVGMGACALVVESEDAVRERGMRGVVELLSSETANSAFHGTRLDVDHISQVMNSLLTAAERRFGIDRRAIAQQTVFVSHETYTPARGGSASAEVKALRSTFGDAASEIVMANTKGFTGHPMGVGIEDVIALKILEHGIVPPVPNFKEIDPELGPLTLSRGGRYPVQFAIHLAAGFGSQVAMTLTRRIPGALDRVDSQPRYLRWLADVSGYDRPETEVVKRVLRVKAMGAPIRQPAPSVWQSGTAPTLRAAVPGDSMAYVYRPAPLVVPTADHRPPTTDDQPLAPAAVLAARSVEPAPISQPQVVTSDKPSIDGNGYPYTNGAISWSPLTEMAAAPVAVAPLSDTVAVATVPTVASPVAEEQVVSVVLQIVAEKTGYPREMLDLDLDLEADLGIDTVKQAETFAAVRAVFDIPRQENLKLHDFPTLGSVVQFVYTNRPDLKPTTDHRRPTTDVQSIESREQRTEVVAPVVADQVIETVLEIVAEKTGYPQEMLDLDLDLEADLGVDTVKQAETFAAIRTAFDIPRQENLKLRDYPTLASVIQFVYTNRPDLRTESPGLRTELPQSEAPAVAAVPAQSSALSPHYSLEEADRVPRRVPVPALRPALDLCKPTGVALDEHARVVVMMDRGGVGKALRSRLDKRGVGTLVLENPPSAEALESQIKTWLAEGPIQGVYWLPALDAEPAIEELDLAAWREQNRVRVKNFYLMMRALYESISAPRTFLVAATRLGGLHGYGDEGATAPLGGAVCGFTKAYKRERPDALVKVVDFEAGRKTAEPAEALIAETLGDPGVVEVGYHDGLRYTVTLEERPAADGSAGMVLTKDTVFVVTGAAGGITSAIVGDLAAASGGVFYLLDLTAEPQADDPNIALFRADKEALKHKLIDELKAAGERPTPVMIDKRILAIERAEAAQRAIQAVQAAGGTAYYRSVNLLDGPAVTAVIDDVRSRYGRIDVLLHAGGIEISKTLDAKEPQEFDLVFDIKADGFFNILKAAQSLAVGATVAFSSVAGRFGNSGQTDYSAANDLLCKLTSSMRAWQPDTRAIAIDWTAWGGIGMATRGSIPKIMELAGIDTLPPEAGIPTIRRELTAGGTCGEIVVGQRLGILAEEYDPDGGLDAEKMAKALAERERPYLMLGKVVAAKLYGGLEVETTLDPQAQPFLYDHQIDGVPVLPGVMGTEAFAELASLLAPGYHVAAVQCEQFHSPFKFYRNQPRTLYLSATISPTSSGELLARTALRSLTEPPRPGLPAREDLHFTAEARLTREPANAPITLNLPAPLMGEGPGVRVVDKSDIYRVYFHGPAYQVLERAWVESDRAVGLMADGLPANTAPDEIESLVAPRLIELCFQTAGLWEMASKGVMALPLAVGSVTTYRRLETAAGRRLYALITPVEGGAAFDAQVVDEAGDVYVELNGYRTVQLPGSVNL
jgi:acyl transferase domain-containing protein/NAD(P)-dependent dehydrogenase (short-subunit alcohol dehydrogenase family)